ncbi:MAG TPA: HEAT repeat domain-containing protein [Ktedonosporobacter sp.]|nr:HEAT repeat domain-containing protein [Ktedonosporobacter sp.]
MEYEENMWPSRPDKEETRGALEQPQVPSTLLPTVLQRLGLASDQPQAELTMADLAAQLTSESWEVRAAAVRALGKRQIDEASMALLVTALDDTDEAVRAAAVSALGKRERHAPLHYLLTALNDSSWRVRESAVCALASQGPRVPREVLVTALHDTDGSVREVARLVLQQDMATQSQAASYGKLWEQKPMQQESTGSNEQTYHTSFETEPHNIPPGTAYDGDSASAYAMREQAQTYAPSAQEYERPFYDGDAMSPRWEKATSYPRRKVQKGWWAAVALTALIFFVLGALFAGGSVATVMPFTTHVKSVQSQAMPGPPTTFNNPQFTSIATNDIANSLHLDPSQITAQLQAGKSMTDIAAAQNVSADQLHAIELKALDDMLNQEVKAGIIPQEAATGMSMPFQKDPQMLDKLVAGLFLDNSSGK